MSHYPRYRKYRPKLLHRRTPILWWVNRWTYVRFIIRELTAVAVAAFAVTFLLLIRSVAAGPEAYGGFIEVLRSPLALLMHTLIFIMAIYHAVTWFNLAPKAMVIRVGSRKVPGKLIAGANFAAWAVLSATLAWILLS